MWTPHFQVLWHLSGPRVLSRLGKITACLQVDAKPPSRKCLVRPGRGLGGQRARGALPHGLLPQPGQPRLVDETSRTVSPTHVRSF